MIGVAIRLALAHRVAWLANALGMSLALLTMQLTTSTHPRGGLRLVALRLGPGCSWL